MDPLGLKVSHDFRGPIDSNIESGFASETSLLIVVGPRSRRRISRRIQVARGRTNDMAEFDLVVGLGRAAWHKDASFARSPIRRLHENRRRVGTSTPVSAAWPR